MHHTVDPLYLPQLQKSVFYDMTSENAHDCVAEVHLVKTGVSKHLTRYRSAHRSHKSYTVATVDMFKLVSDDPSGVIDEAERTSILVQEYSWWAGRKTLKREYLLSCEQANNLYKNLLKHDFYKR